MYRVWYSTESFADYIIDHTNLKDENVKKNKIYESDANNPRNFHTVPDHIRKILYLDSPDLIVEKEGKAIFSIEVSTEAGTGHNAFQRFARLAASVENDVPAFYIYPEASIITRRSKDKETGESVDKYTWDSINPSIYFALEEMMSIYDIPALLFYFPSDYQDFPNPEDSSLQNEKGIRYDPDIVKYSACPSSSDIEMKYLFTCINVVIESTKTSVVDGRTKLLRKLEIRKRRRFMQDERSSKSQGRDLEEMSPITATVEVPTKYILNYLKNNYETDEYKIGELLRNRKMSVIYQANAKFRGDPYPGALAAIDYLCCREGKTYEDRKKNLIMAFGSISVDKENEIIKFANNTTKKSSIKLLEKAVSKVNNHNLLTRSYDSLENYEIPRYYMQMRYGSTYSKVKHIRVYSYFADAIMFPDGSLWRDG